MKRMKRLILTLFVGLLCFTYQAKAQWTVIDPSNLVQNIKMCIRDSYATEVSVPEYLAYTTEETEKVEVQRLAGELGGDMELAIRQLAEGKR